MKQDMIEAIVNPRRLGSQHDRRGMGPVMIRIYMKWPDFNDSREASARIE
jgi:hypothetical protein